MTPALQSALLFALATLGFLALGTIISALTVTLARRRISPLEPRSRHRVLVGLAAAPLLTAFVLIFAASLPSLLALVRPGFDHCAAHDDGHAHLCFTHLPTLGVHAGGALVVMCCALYAGVGGLVLLARARRKLHVLGVLSRTTDHCPELGASVIDTSAPLCFAAGLVHPQVFVSRGLLAALDGEQRSIVLAHERAHVARRDALVTSIARLMVRVHFPAVGRWLIREIEIAAEQACDEHAATMTGDRLAVAQAILAVERLALDTASDAFGTFAVAFGEKALDRRIEALVAPVPEPVSMRPAIFVVFAIVGAVFTTTYELHHLTESALAFLAL